MASRLGVQTVKKLDLIGAEVVQQTTAAMDHAYAKQLLASGAVDYIEPNYIYTIDRTPNDAQYSQLWGMNNTGQTGGTSGVDIDAPEAWDITTGDDTVVVGVVDTGVNYTHPDLAANVWTNPGEIAGNGVDDDGDGVIDDVHGYNAIAHSGNPMDDNGHGSHCSGTIGGVGNNSAGVVGVNWKVKIMGLKFLNSSGSGTTSAAIDAINYAVRMKQRGVNIRVLSNSWGGGGQSQALSDAIAEAEQNGILFVAAAGNNSSDNDSVPTYPANYTVGNVVSVAAIDSSGNLASFSNYGATMVHVAAPGVGIYSTVLGSNYASYNGTSMATPHVSGVAALVIGHEPSLTPSQLKTRLMVTVKSLSTLQGVVASGGLVNAKNALLNTVAPAPTPTPQIRYSRVFTSADYDDARGSRILAVDDGFSDQSLPFTFTYYGVDYSRIGISANGRIVPLLATDSLPSSNDYSNRLWPGINVFNDDLFPSPFSPTEAGIWFKADSTGATITWVVTTYSLRASTDSRAEMRIQAKLLSNGKIEFHYLDTDTGDTGTSFGASATVGIAPPTGVSGATLQILHNTSSESTIGDGKGIRFTRTRNLNSKDFDGDSISDIVVWRPSTGMWFILTSHSGFAFDQQRVYQLGSGAFGDIPLVGDFDGDGLSDLAVWRPYDGNWFLRKSGDSYETVQQVQWGLPGDKPMIADFDGDGKSDLVVYRVRDGKFYALTSSLGFNRSDALKGRVNASVVIHNGAVGYDPVVGDFTGEGKDSTAAVYQLIRFWTIKNANGQFLSSQPWGAAGDTPLACDYDGNGVADRVAVRIMNDWVIHWFIATDSGPVYEADLGSYHTRDIPSCDKDFDGDGKVDLTVFETTTGNWNVRESSSGLTRTYAFGLPGDVPL